MKLKNGKQKLRQKDLQYERKKHIYDFQQYDNIRFLVIIFILAKSI